MIETARRVTGREIPAEAGPRRAGDPAVPAAGSAKIKRELGRSPRCRDLETIVRTARAWHARHLEGYGELQDL